MERTVPVAATQLPKKGTDTSHIVHGPFLYGVLTKNTYVLGCVLIGYGYVGGRNTKTLI